MDAALRLAEGSDLPTEAYEEGPPIVLLNKENVGQPVPSWNAPLDFREQFEKIWKVR